MVAKTKTAKAKSKTPARKPAAKKTTSKKTTNVKKPAATGGATREMNPDTGFVVGSDQDVIATALMEGGESRAAIVDALEKRLDSETRNGTPKQITNMVSGVFNKMLKNGYEVEQSFIVTPPTPASKRAATRRANAAAKSAPAAKPAAKKTAAKKTTSRKTTTKSAPATKGKTTTRKPVAKKGKVTRKK